MKTAKQWLDAKDPAWGDVYGEKPELTESIIEAIQADAIGTWQDADAVLPQVNDKFGDSHPVLCLEGDDRVPFVGWYNEKTKQWTILHHLAPNLARSVRYWLPLPPTLYEHDN